MRRKEYYLDFLKYLATLLGRAVRFLFFVFIGVMLVNNIARQSAAIARTGSSQVFSVEFFYLAADTLALLAAAGICFFSTHEDAAYRRWALAGVLFFFFFFAVPGIKEPLLQLAAW